MLKYLYIRLHTQDAMKRAFATQRGFTLIELLIVVAILTVLSAIATPNFLEAQTRAKVSRTHSDLRALATAMETYRVDNSKYPAVGNPDRPSRADLYIPIQTRMLSLTTPVSYITSLPKDPFYKNNGNYESVSHDYIYAPGNLYLGAGPRYNGSAYRNTIYSIAGRGPDGDIYAGGYCMAHPLAYENKTNITGMYDATNGTVSAGDVYQLGSGTLGQNN